MILTTMMSLQNVDFVKTVSNKAGTLHVRFYAIDSELYFLTRENVCRCEVFRDGFLSTGPKTHPLIDALEMMNAALSMLNISASITVSSTVLYGKDVEFPV